MTRWIYSSDGLHLTEEFEANGGPILIAYADPLAGGRPTVGYGHTGVDVIVGTVWTQEQCEAALVSDIQWASNVVNTLVTFGINQCEFDALVDFVFNVGSSNFAKSTLLIDLNEGDLPAAIDQFDRWDHASGKVVAGLLRRRQAETAMFSGVSH